ncbi:putative ribonuclease H-like domain-containing protein [Tanacetum coccineum]
MAKQVELNKQKGKGNVQREIKPVWNNVPRVNHKNQFVPTAVLTRTGKILVSTARASGTNNVSTVRHNFNNHAVLTNAGVRPNTVFHKTHSLFRRPFNRTTTLRTKFSKHKVINTAKVNAVSAVRGKRETAVKPSAGIKREYSNARTPQQNGVAERKNMTLIEAARTMLADSFLPNTFWAEAVSTACYVLNRDYFVLPIWSSYTSTVKSSKAKNAGKEPNKNYDLKTDENPVDKEEQVFLDELERLKRQEQDANDAAEALRKEFAKDTEDLLLQAGAAKASSTNTVNTASTPVSTDKPKVSTLIRGYNIY